MYEDPCGKCIQGDSCEILSVKGSCVPLHIENCEVEHRFSESAGLLKFFVTYLVRLVV